MAFIVFMLIARSATAVRWCSPKEWHDNSQPDAPPYCIVQRTIGHRGVVAYNGDYLYALTRALGSSDLHPVGRLVLVPLTVVADTVLLPVAVLLGAVDHV